MLIDFKVELIRIGRKLKNIVVYDVYDIVDSFDFYKTKFFDRQTSQQKIVNTLNKKRNAFS